MKQKNYDMIIELRKQFLEQNPFESDSRFEDIEKIQCFLQEEFQSEAKLEVQERNDLLWLKCSSCFKNYIRGKWNFAGIRVRLRPEQNYFKAIAIVTRTWLKVCISIAVFNLVKQLLVYYSNEPWVIDSINDDGIKLDKYDLSFISPRYRFPIGKSWPLSLKNLSENFQVGKLIVALSLPNYSRGKLNLGKEKIETREMRRYLLYLERNCLESIPVEAEDCQFLIEAVRGILIQETDLLIIKTI